MAKADAAKRVDYIGSLLVLWGMILGALCVGHLAGFWWGCLLGSAEMAATGLALCRSAARMDEGRNAGERSSPLHGDGRRGGA